MMVSAFIGLCPILSLLDVRKLVRKVSRYIYATSEHIELYPRPLPPPSLKNRISRLADSLTHPGGVFPLAVCLHTVSSSRTPLSVMEVSRHSEGPFKCIRTRFRPEDEVGKRLDGFGYGRFGRFKTFSLGLIPSVDAKDLPLLGDRRQLSMTFLPVSFASPAHTSLKCCSSFFNEHTFEECRLQNFFTWVCLYCPLLPHGSTMQFIFRSR